MNMKASRFLLLCVALAWGAGPLAALENETARRDQLKRLRAAIRAYGLLYPGKSPTTLGQLLDENLVDGTGDLMRPGATAVPPRTELDARGDYTLETLPDVADMVVREKTPLTGETEVLAIFTDGAVKPLPVPVANAAPSRTAVPSPTSSPGAPGNPPLPPITLPPSESSASTGIGASTGPAPPPVAFPGAGSATPSISMPGVVVPRGQTTGPDLGQMLQAANSAFAQGNLAAARQGYEAVLRAHSASTEARLGLGRCQNAVGEIDAAIVSYQAVQRAAPATPNLGVWLAELYLAKGDLATARRVLETELRAATNAAWTLSWLGSVELESNNRAAAQRHFARAVQLDANVVADRYSNASWLGQTNQLARAAREALAVMMMNPNHAGAYYVAGDAYARLGQTASAIQYFERYLQFDATSQWAMHARQQIQHLKAARR